MAAAFGFATSIAPSTPSNPNLRPLAVSCPQLQTFYKPLNNRRASALNQSLRVRCESVSQNLNSIDKEELKRSSAMALAQLKASAIDGIYDQLFFFLTINGFWFWWETTCLSCWSLKGYSSTLHAEVWKEQKSPGLFLFIIFFVHRNFAHYMLV